VGCSSDSPSAPRVPTSAQEINKAQNEILANANPLNIQKGEFTYFVQTQEIYTGQQNPSVSLIAEEGITILDRHEEPGYIEITVQKEIIDHLQEGSPHSVFKDVFYISTESTSDEENNEGTPDPLIKYYNLVIRDEVFPKPAKVLEKEPCLEPKDCVLNVKKISYDVVFEDPVSPQTTKVEAWLSDQVPYFATILRSCYSTIVSIDTARPLVRQCKTVFDYQF
jgi:hypothetical protein